MLDKIKKERILLLLGAVFLALAVLILTIVPFVVNNFIADAFVSINSVKNISITLYILTIICFLYSFRYIKMQINWIIIIFIYYALFQILVKIISP